MKYDPKTHLLRQLEPGEIIKADDLVPDIKTGEMTENIIGDGKPYDSNMHRAHFRPVPRTTGWRPRSEAAEEFAGLPKDSLVAVQNGDACSTGCPVMALMCEWHAFYIIPPCDLPPPDPERERFEKWIAPRGFNVEREPDGEYRYETARNSWDAWQAAARKENA